MINVYGIKNCNKMRDTFNWMDEHKIEYQFTDVKKEPLSDEKLAEFADKVGIDVLVNKRGMKWRQLGLADKDLSEQDLFDVLLENQTMMKRPVLENGEALLIGYDEDAFKDFMD
jgi:Spx/MgsR family transcriptional regulator